jgi:hypothetical protein
MLLSVLWALKGDQSEGALLAIVVSRLQFVSRYSDRKAGHWFHSEKNGLSIAGESSPQGFTSLR